MSTTPPGAPPVPVLHEDNHVLGVFKPAGWLVQGARPGDRSVLESLREWIRVRDRKPGAAFLAPVHRLDRPVCGVVVLAKRSKAASRLSEQIREGRFEKTYRTIVEGEMNETAGPFVDPLVWDDAARRARVAEAGAPDARYAELECRPIDGAPAGFTALEIRLLTGRKHQIRAQLAERGHPVAGDGRYGARSSLGESIALVAGGVRFSHPTRPEEEVRLAVPAELDPFPAWVAALAGR